MPAHHEVLTRRAFLAGGLAVTAVGACAVPARAAQAAAPPIAGTAEWGAREPSGPIEVLDTKPDKIIVHHTATDNVPDTSQAHAFGLSRWIQNLHMDRNGWVDSGQQFTNSRGGWLTEGRHYSLAALRSGTQHVVGTHAGDQNRVALGIENEGTYLSEPVPQALWDSLVSLCAHMVTQYGLAAGEIYGHRDFMVTQCPGDVLYGRLAELREAVGAATQQRVAHPPVWPLMRPGDTGPAVTALQYLLRAQGAGRLPVDGVFGGETQRTASQFAAARGLTAPSCSAMRTPEPGVFGGSAWAALAPVLPADARGEAARALQVLLTARGHSAPDADRTTRALRDFQVARGLPITTVVDHRTWQQLLN